VTNEEGPHAQQPLTLMNISILVMVCISWHGCVQQGEKQGNPKSEITS